MGNKTLADGTEIYESEFTGKQIDDLLKLVKTEEELRTFILSVADGENLTEAEVNQLIVAYARENNLGASDEVIRNVCQEYFGENDITSGQDGVGIQDIQKISTNGNIDTYIITLTNGTTKSFTVKNGVDGEDGHTPTTEEIKGAVEAYLGEHPVESGTVSVVSADIPIIFLEGDSTGISKENAVPMKMRFVSKTMSFEDTCTLKYQGTSSLNYPKKNFTAKLNSKHDVGWGNQKKYCLKANYIDHSHARNIVSARLWSQIVSSRSDYADMPELLKASPNNGAVDGFPVRLYLNESYQGLYTMNIPKGSWQFKMNDTNEQHCILCGEDYVSGLFRGAAKIDETDWSDELHDVVPESVKTRWNEIINFVRNSTDNEFKTNITNYIDLNSMIDYYIFAYVSTGLDALGKNQIYYTYDGQKYYASMYDMDSTWGMYWNGQRYVSEKYRMQDDYESKVDGRAGNLLYERLENLFSNEIEARYEVLRNGALSFSNILEKFEKFMGEITTEKYAEDIAIYNGIPSGDTNNINQIRSYVPKRLAYVDSMIYKVNVEGITLNYESKSVNQDKSFKLTPVFTPSNANNYFLTWKTNSDNVTVENGVVRGVSVGVATVTVTDEISGLSASCEVTVIEKQEGGDISATAIYELAETGFDGISDYVDTGVKLFDTDKAFTIFLEFESASDATMVEYGHNLLNSQIEQFPYPGIVIRNQNGSMCIVDGNNNNRSLGIADTSKHKLMINHEMGASTINYYVDGTTANSMQHIAGAHEQNVIIGACYDGSSYGRFFKGTIHKCAIYNDVLSDDDIGVLMQAN